MKKTTSLENETAGHRHGDGVNVPDHFRCPISLEIMSSPYRDRTTGHSYGQVDILEWIYFGKATCPLTRKPLHPSNFELNLELQGEILSWKRRHGFPEEEEGNDYDWVDKYIG